MKAKIHTYYNLNRWVVEKLGFFVGQESDIVIPSFKSYEEARAYCVDHNLEIVTVK